MDSSNPSDVPSDSSPFILAHQRPAFENLQAIGRACFSVQRKTIPLGLRTNTLVVGPTGTGKTFLAREVARELGVAFMPLAASNWVLVGCTSRGAEITWSSILNFLYRNRDASGVVIFLDELDKLTGVSSWDVHLRVEVFQLLDLTLPIGLKDVDDDLVSSDVYAAAQDVISNRAFIIGGGAFQHLWEARSKPGIGFRDQAGRQTSSPPRPDELTQTLPREIVNRFHGKLQVLPELQRSDYVRMLEKTVAKVPSYLREAFLHVGYRTLDEALELRRGVRFLEDAMLDAILAERSSLQITSAPSEKQESPKEKPPVEQDNICF